jgi:hypothetical protein
MIEARTTEIESKVDNTTELLAGALRWAGNKTLQISEAGSMISGHTNLEGYSRYHNMESRPQNQEQRFEELKEIPPSITRPSRLRCCLYPGARFSWALGRPDEKLKHQPFRLNSQESEEWILQTAGPHPT